MKIVPIGDRVLIEPVQEQESVVGGIYIPDAAREKPQLGKVIAVGIGVVSGMKVGDAVLIPKFGGVEVKLGARVYQLLREDDVLGIVL